MKDEPGQAEAPLHRPLRDVDMLDTGEGNDRVIAEQEAACNVKLVRILAVAPRPVAPWRKKPPYENGDDREKAGDEPGRNIGHPSRAEIEKQDRGQVETQGEKGVDSQHVDLRRMERLEPSLAGQWPLVVFFHSHVVTFLARQGKRGLPNGEWPMFSRPMLRGVLVGAILALAVVLAIHFYRHSGGEPARAPEFDPSSFVQPQPQLDAPYVATDYEVVDAMLALAEVRPNDYVIDLGSGDGRILIAAARSHGARGLGVDIDPRRVAESIENAKAARVTHRVEFRRQDLFDTPLEQADVLTLYLTPEVNLRLRPRILDQMQPGARVVSHDFDMGDWRPDARTRVGTATLMLWRVPARVEGTWRLDVGGREAELRLDQSYQEVEGMLRLDGSSRRIEQGRLAGTRIRFVVDAGEGRRTFVGEVAGDRIEGIEPAGWTASRTR